MKEGGLKASSIIADDVRRRIATGEFRAGDALPNETQLMEQYEVSRPTVRGAIRILENESLVAVKLGQGGGPRVQIPDPTVLARQFSLQLQVASTSLKDVFDARALIEPAAVRILATRRSKKVINTLKALHQQELDLADDPEKFAAATAEFHEKVVELAGNQTLALVARLLQHMVAGQNVATLQRHHQSKRVAQIGMDEHEALIRLLEAGAVDEAEQLWLQHMTKAAAAALHANGPKSLLDLFGPSKGPYGEGH